MKYIYTFTILVYLSFGLSWAQEDVFSGTQTGMTDYEIHQQDTYEHAGVVQEATTAACAKALEEIKSNTTNSGPKATLEGCNEATFDEAANVFGGETGKVIEAMIPAATKMYAMVFGAAGVSKIRSEVSSAKGIQRRSDYLDKQGTKITDPNQKAAYENEHWEQVDVLDKETGQPTGKTERKLKSKEETEEQPDHCAKIPMATEILGGAIQLLGQNKIEENAQPSNGGIVDQQKSSFYQVANTHKLRKKTALVQASGWGATSACYIGYVVRSYSIGMNPKWDTFAKIAAGGFLTTFFALKAKNHGIIEKAVRGMGDNLPGPGECNPHSQTQCFCGRDDSVQVDPANYRKYCVAKEYADSAFETPAGCVTENMETDTQCNCKANNTCFNHKMAQAARGIGINNAFMSDSIQGLDMMGSGGFDTSKLNDFSGKMGALSSDFLRKHEGDINPKIKLSSNKKVADSLVNAGLPAKIAQIASSFPSNSAAESGFARAASLDRLRESAGVTSAVGYKNKGKSYSRSNSYGSSNNPFGKYGNKKKEMNKNPITIQHFQDEATKQAEITNDTSRPIFEIITHRYRASAWKKFDVYNLQNQPLPKN